MNFPTLTEISYTPVMTDVFYGYDHNARIGDGAFYDMENLTSDRYPVMSPRGQRGLYASPQSAGGIIAKDILCYVDGTDFVMGECHIDIGLSEGQKSLVSMGAYVIILPDRKWVNTANYSASTGTFTQENGYGDIDAEYQTVADASGNTWTKFTLCKQDGTSYTDVSDSEPQDPNNGDLWLDQSSTPHALKQYSSTTAAWINIPTTYIKIESAGIDDKFGVWDGVTIGGLGEDVTLHDYDASGAELLGTVRGQLEDLNGSAVVWATGENYIVIVGILDREVTIADQISVTRKMPQMDFVIESDNRLWGCRYGLANNGQVVNEIYASRLGDFKNWNTFLGTSEDSYVASCGTDGRFTGAITHLGYPLFFKEDCMHKVYGKIPSNFQIQSTACRGVEKGSERSLAIVNEVLYYKSPSGICAYDGSLPAEVGMAFGEKRYRNAVAGSFGNKYYVSMQDVSNSKYSLFVYDAARKMWHREDELQAEAFCPCRGDLYFIDHADGKIKTVCGTGTKDTAPISWYAETGIIGMDMGSASFSSGKKYLSRVLIRLTIDDGATFKVYAQYDTEGTWEQVFSVTGTSLRTFVLPIRPRRCDHLRLRFAGTGDCRVYSVTKKFEQGSDV